MDGMTDYMRTPSRMMFPDVADLEAASSFLNSEKARSLGLLGSHHHGGHPFGSLHPPPRIPNTLPLAAIQQHLYSMQQQQQQQSRHNSFPMPSPSSSSASPSPSNNGTAGSGANSISIPPLPPGFPAIPFPHHLLSQWTMAAAGFGLFGLGLPPMNNPPTPNSPLPPNCNGVDHSPPHSSSANSNKLNSSLSPVSHRFSPYPTLSIGKTAPNLNSSASSDHASTPPPVEPVSPGP